MKHPIPDAALDGRLAIVGISGSGKSTTAKGGVERLLAQGRRVCIVDLLDGWWGLRVKRDGETPAYPVAIFGGAHGDLPLTEHAGALIGQAVAQSEGSTIVSLSELDGDASRRRFALAFFNALHSRNRAPLHLVIDEADFYAPQNTVKEGPGPLLLNRVKEIAARGRMKGFRCWPITQRPAKLNKDVLSQAETLIAMQLTSSQDRDAIEGWIGDQGDKTLGKAILASLPSLKLGQGVLWAPKLGILEAVNFPLPGTYDSSRTPEYGEAASDVELKPIDLGALREKLAKVDTEVKANNPAALRAEISRLKVELAKKPAPAAPVVDEGSVDAARTDGYASGFADANLQNSAVMRTLLTRMNVASKEVGGALDFVSEAEKVMTQASAKPAQIRPPAKAHSNGIKPPQWKSPPPRARVSSTAGADLTGPQRHLLRALAWWAQMGHDEPRRPQIAAIAGWVPSGSNLKDRLSELKKAGLVEYPRDGYARLTPEGAAAAPEPDRGATMVEGIRKVLTGPQRVLFDAVLNLGGGPLDRQALAARVGWEPAGSNLKDRLSELKRLEVVVYPTSGIVEISDWLRQEIG